MSSETKKLLVFFLPVFVLFSFSAYSQHKVEDMYASAKLTNEVSNDKDSVLLAERLNKEVFVVVDRTPQYPGGEERMMLFITQRAHLPVETGKHATKGKILMQFIVERDGSLSNLKVLKGIKPGYDQECLRVFGLMPKWNPGCKGSHYVRTLMMVPITFL